MQTVKPFSDGALITVGWERFKEKFGTLILATLVFVLILVGLVVVGAVLSEVHEALTVIFVLIAFIAALVMAPGFTRLFLNIIDHKEAKVGTLFSEAGRALPLLAVKLLYGLIVMGGLILFIVPGIYWALEFCLAPWLVVDKKMKVMDALRESARITKGYKWDILAFYKVVSMVASIGIIAFYVGIIVTIPIGILAFTALYRQLESGKDVLA
jgi:uncharacterized membrane protein